MQIIKPTNVNVKAHGIALNALAVNKRSYPVYFNTDTGTNIKNADANAITASSEFVVSTADISGTVSTGSYIKIDSEVMKVLDLAADTITMLISRGELETTPAAHAKNADIYVHKDHLTEIELNGADDPVPESFVALNITDASIYDISFSIVVKNVTDNNSGTAVTLEYAFAPKDDVPLTDAGKVSLALSEQSTTAVTLPNGTLNLFYTTERIPCTSRYLYLWCVSDGAVILTNSCDYYVYLNTV